MKKTLFTNANIITATGIHPGELLVVDGVIAEIASQDRTHVQDAEIIDVKSDYLSPGFIDTHTHGGGGYDFMDGSLEAIYSAAKTHMIHGTTTIYPTTITSTKASLIEFVNLFNKVEMNRTGLPHIAGLHLEGPFFAYEQRGAQGEEHLRNPDPAEYEKVLEMTDRIARWSFAVELEGSSRFLQALQKHGIISSLAHSDATTEEVFSAYENGLSAMTHFYSAMSGVRRINTYRVGGAIEAGYLLDDIYVEVIADGKHLPAELLQLIYKIKGTDRICLVTDSMRGAAMPDGEYVLGNKETGMTVIVEDDVAKVSDRSSFAGSVATTDRLVRTMHSLTTAPLHEVVRMMTLIPAKMMKTSNHNGSIAVGKDADLIIFDKDINVSTVMVSGEVTYKI